MLGILDVSVGLDGNGCYWECGVGVVVLLRWVYCWGRSSFVLIKPPWTKRTSKTDTIQPACTFLPCIEISSRKIRGIPRSENPSSGPESRTRYYVIYERVRKRVTSPSVLVRRGLESCTPYADLVHITPSYVPLPPPISRR